MSARRSFLRDIALTIAASLVPRILQPAVPEIAEEELVAVNIEFRIYDYPLTPDMAFTVSKETWHLPKEAAEQLQVAVDLNKELRAVGG